MRLLRRLKKVLRKVKGYVRKYPFVLGIAIFAGVGTMTAFTVVLSRNFESLQPDSIHKPKEGLKNESGDLVNPDTAGGDAVTTDSTADATTGSSQGLKSTTPPGGQSDGVASQSGSGTTTQETPQQIYAREYNNLQQASYALSSSPTRSESGGFIYYTVTLQVTALNPASFGSPTLFAQLVPSTNNRYLCTNPVGTMVTFIYGTGGNTVSLSCRIQPCPECYYPGGPLPYYGAFTVEAGGITNSGGLTGVGSRSYDLAPGYDRPS